MRAAGRTPARLAQLTVALAVAAIFLLGTAGARANQSSETTRETQRLRAANDGLRDQSQAALLELYALQSELGRVEARVGVIAAQVDEVEARRAAAADRLVLVKRTLGEAERRLALRLNELYVEGGADPLAVLLGSESLGEAVATLDNLGTFAKQDAVILAQVKQARADVRDALAELERRSGELEGLLAAAQSARAGLVSAQEERRSYLARLEAEQRLNEAQLVKLTAQAETAEAKAQEVSAGTASSAGGSSSGGSVTVEATPLELPAGPAGPGTTMTVQATGYALSGTTATGMPVGWGVVAVDPSVIPLGTRMTIPGYGEGVAADTGTAVRGAAIDLWFPTHAQALAWGRRTVTITLH